MVPSPAETITSTAAPTRRWRRVFAAAAVLVCLLVPVARLTAPSDLHDQTQEKTSAYTTDIALHSHDWRRWVLPLQQGTEPATKPPLYNWLAAPAVWLVDGTADWPHRLPSLLAFAALCLLLWRLGDSLDPRGLTGPLAAMILATNYAWFKLSVLVRPDTLLSLWLALGWVGVTIVLSRSADPRSRRRWKGLIWIACALAVLTKGPPALIIPLFAFALGWFAPGARSRGRWRQAAGALRDCGAWWGMPAVLGITALWLFLVWRVDPDHLYNTLIREEFVDRAMGIGDEGVKHGPWDFLRTALNMPLYFITRFVPWSILFFGALIDLRKERESLATPEPAPYWIRSGLLYTALVVIVFTLSAGKRADYIASASISAALVTAWCLVHLGWRLATTRPALILSIVALTLTGLIVHERTNGYAQRFPLADALRDFADEVRPIIDAESRPLVFYRTGVAPLQVMLSRSQPVVTSADDLAQELEQANRSWLITSDRGLEEVLAEAGRRGWRMELLATSEPARSSAAAAPLEMRLYLVTPGPP